MSPKFINYLPLPEFVKKQALDFKFHWVNENGDDAKLTAGIILKPTVCSVSGVNVRIGLCADKSVGFVQKLPTS